MLDISTATDVQSSRGGTHDHKMRMRDQLITLQRERLKDVERCWKYTHYIFHHFPIPVAAKKVPVASSSE